MHLRSSQPAPGKMDGGSDPESCSTGSDVDESCSDSGSTSSSASGSDACSDADSDPGASGGSDPSSGSDESNDATAVECSEANSSGDSDGEVGEVEAEHNKECCTLGKLRCARCRWICCRSQWRKKLIFQIAGERGSWVEECVDVNESWGLGCKVCRWAGESSKFARGEIRGSRASRFYQLLLRHGNHTRATKRNRVNRGHAGSLLKLARERVQPDAPATPDGSVSYTHLTLPTNREV